MNRKWDLEKVRIEFEKRNFRLLTTHYTNTKQKLVYIARCGHEHEVTFDNFKAGKGDLCKECRYKSNADKFRSTYDEVRQIFKGNQCELISDSYIDPKKKLLYIAQCGHENRLELNKFKMGAGRVCNKCSKSIRYEYDYVKEYFENENCLLLETEYINVKTPMRYIATCGHEHITTFDTFKNAPSASKRCENCQKIKHHTLEDIGVLMNDEGCTLLSEEYKPEKPLHYIAKCGHKTKMTLYKFLSGRGRLCRKCCRPQGERHHNYNEKLTNEERIQNRDLYEIVKWRNAVYERDNYTCQKCKNQRGGNLNAHHINGYNLDKENRFNIDNGITLCKDCHNNFHKRYGFGNNTQIQFDEWFYGNTEVSENITRHRNA